MSGVAGWKDVNPRWSAVDQLIGSHLLRDDPVLEGVLKHSEAAGLPDIAVSPAQGKFLQMVAELAGVRRVLEIGTLGGFSTIHFARAVGAEGKVVTLECDPDYARVAEENIAAAALQQRVEVQVGQALDLLGQLSGPFDLTFIDADKVSNVDYVEHALRLSEKGALIIVDNVVRQGDVLDPQDESALGTKALYEHLQNHPQLDGTVLQTVGEKGWDGMMLLRVV